MSRVRIPSLAPILSFIPSAPGSGAVLFRITTTDHDDCDAVAGSPLPSDGRGVRGEGCAWLFCVLAMELLQLRREHVARAAMWIGEDQQNALVTQLFQR